MELRHLRYFVAVGTELNFSKAAERLFVSQPALSTQIADLEEEVGVRLLQRNTRSVRLTAAGRVFLDDARAILRSADASVDRARRTARGEEGELSVAFFAAPTMLFLPDLIRRYKAAYPQVTVRMRELTPDRQLEAFARGEIDIGFTRPMSSGRQELQERVLFLESFYAVMAENHPLASRPDLSLAELAKETFVLLDRPVATSLYDHVISACRSAGFSPAVVHTPDLMATVLMLVAAGQGVSLVPEGVRNLRDSLVSFVPIHPAIDPIPLVVAWCKAQDSPQRDAFLQLVSDSAGDLRP